MHRMETEDLVTATFAFENGAIGTRGTAVFNGDTLEVAFRDGTRESVGGEKSGSGAGADPMAFGHEMHRALLQDFVDAIRKGTPLRVTGEDALKAHRFIDAILTASR